MRADKLVRAASACVISSFGVVGLTCGSNPVAPADPEQVYVEVHVTGGFAGVDFTYAVDGADGVARGVACVRVCEFEPGEILMPLTRAQILYFSDRLVDAGIVRLNGRDFGVQCCDQFYYTIRYRYGGREALVKGSSEALPPELREVVAELDRLVQGIVPILLKFDTRPEDWPRDALVLREHSLEGSALTLAVEFGGGCKDHELDLVAWGGWLESFPVQVNVLLAHEDHDDPCDALISPVLRFDLTPLRDAYLESYSPGGPGGSNATTVILRLTVPDGQAPRAIEYTF